MASLPPVPSGLLQLISPSKARSALAQEEEECRGESQRSIFNPHKHPAKKVVYAWTNRVFQTHHPPEAEAAAAAEA